MDTTLCRAADAMARAIADRLTGCTPSIYLFGSCTMDDYRPGWSDIDILVLTQQRIRPDQADALLMLRQTLPEVNPAQPRNRSFEGGMLTLDALLHQTPDTVVYWGTSGQRITDRYAFDACCLWTLLHHGVLLRGPEVRDRMPEPTRTALNDVVRRHLLTVREHAAETGRSLYSLGWMLDLSRGLYTLRTGQIATKTTAGEWALREGLCPDPELLRRVLAIRRSPVTFPQDEAALQLAETIAPAVLRYADVLEAALMTAP